MLLSSLSIIAEHVWDFLSLGFCCLELELLGVGVGVGAGVVDLLSYNLTIVFKFK